MVEIEPLLSIVTPYYNGARFLQRVRRNAEIASAYGFELLLVDDGSQSEAFHELKKLAQEFPHIGCLRKKNAGPAAARAMGLARAKGKFVIFLDCDDHLFDETAAECLKLLVDVDPDLLILSEQPTDSYSPEQPRSQSTHTRPVRLYSLLSSILTGHVPFKTAPSQVIFRRASGASSSIVNELTWGEDIPWLLALAVSAQRVVHSEAAVSRWYGPGSRGRAYHLRQVVKLALVVFRTFNRRGMPSNGFRRRALGSILASFVFVRFTISLTFKNVRQLVRRFS